MVACSTLRHISTSSSIARCVRLAMSRTTLPCLPPPPPTDRGIDRTVPAAARERAGRHEGGCGAERQMAPATCLCPPEPFVLNLGMAKYILQYLAQSRVSLHLHDSPLHLYLCSSISQSHLRPTILLRRYTQRNQSLFRITHISSISAFPPREAAHLPVTIPSTTI